MPFINLETKEFKNLMQEHFIKTIEYFFRQNQEFDIKCEISVVTFTPELPKEIEESMSEITRFSISNYSFESAGVENGYLFFEAGFGKESIGAVVQIPILAIKQLFLHEYPEYPMLINLAPSETLEEEEEEIVDSMNALLNNPENAKLLKKKRIQH